MSLGPCGHSMLKGSICKSELKYNIREGGVCPGVEIAFRRSFQKF
jgi:hypothetical protein